MTCDYEFLGFCGHDHGTCENCGRRTEDVATRCWLCQALPFAAYWRWLDRALDRDRREGRGPVLVKAGSDG